ncbi:hypothetical protein K3495_g11429 [Podosphaera aphanis]|nr:hypothetical protein K3495_g11429 [Podosphaera aphanis]
MSLGHRAATRELQSLKTAGAAAPHLPSPNMNEDDDVSGGGTAAGARPSYVANMKDGKHKSSAVAILDDPARICHLIDQGCELCNSEGIICVQGPGGKCARCAAGGISKVNCGVETRPGAAIVVPPPVVTRGNRVVKRPVIIVEAPATGRAVRPDRRKTRSTTAGVSDTLEYDWSPRLLTGLERVPISDSLVGAIVPEYSDEELCETISSAVGPPAPDQAGQALLVLARSMLEVRRANAKLVDRVEELVAEVEELRAQLREDDRSTTESFEA